MTVVSTCTARIPDLSSLIMAMAAQCVPFVKATRTLSDMRRLEFAVTARAFVKPSFAVAMSSSPVGRDIRSETQKPSETFDDVGAKLRGVKARPRARPQDRKTGRMSRFRDSEKLRLRDSDLIASSCARLGQSHWRRGTLLTSLSGVLGLWNWILLTLWVLPRLWVRICGTPMTLLQPFSP